MTERIETITATDLRRDLATILDQIMVYREPVAITRQGKVIAYLVPTSYVPDDGIGDSDAPEVTR